MIAVKKASGMRAMTMLILILAVAALWVTTAVASDVTLVGEVNDNYQIMADGQVYEIADTPAGNELAENHISEKVKVTGTLEERDDMKIITVISYELVAE